MDKVKQLADELYNQKVLDGWKNVSMKTCLKRATDYYRMDEVVKKLTIPAVVDTLPADDLIKSLGEAKESNEYILKTHNGVWWLEHKHVGSGEPLKQWLTDKPISG